MGRLFSTSETSQQATGALGASGGGRLFGSRPVASRAKPDLTSSEGLLQVANQSGLGDRAEKILSTKGEDPNEIFSGGMISDAFDTLNMLQFGITGLIKGKSFLEGIKSRESFSDKDALGEFGVPGLIGGVILDIAVDPLTYIAPLTIAKKIPGLTKLGKASKTAFANTRVGQRLGRAFVYRFGQDPVYRKIAERTEKSIGIGIQNMMDIARPLTKLDVNAQRRIASARKAGKLADLPQDLLNTAEPAFKELDRLGKEAVEAGLLSKTTYDKNVGRYIARLYRGKEFPEGFVGKVKTFFDKKPSRIDLKRFKKRQDIPEDVREAMGEILEAGYPTAKGLVQLTQAVERAKFFRAVSGRFAKNTTTEGFQQLPKTRALGDLSEKFVPSAIFDDIQEIIRSKTAFERGVSKIVGGFKFGKVVLNPATHARNIMSNFILNNFEGLSPLRVDVYAKAAKQIATKGDLYKEAQKVGLGLNTFAAQELRTVLGGAGGAKLTQKMKAALKKASNLYQKEEEFAKMAQYIFQRGKGLNPEDAFKIAERATFNYAQVTPFIRRVRESAFGFPFITFTYKVTPQVGKTLLTKPTKISNIAKIKGAIENQSDLAELTAERAVEPGWIRDGFFVKLPMKDKEGRSAYLDLTYILPFGDLMSGQLFQRDINRETGLRESLPSAALDKAPFFNLVKELGNNQDFFGNRIWRESDSLEKQTADLFRHVVKTYAPPLIADQIPGGIRGSGDRKPTLLQRLTAEQRGQDIGGKLDRTLGQELLRQVGLKVNLIDLDLQKTFAESEKRRALQTLLKEEGEVAEFSRPFIPKDK